MFYQLLFHFFYLVVVVGVLPRVRELVVHELGVELVLMFLVFVEVQVWKLLQLFQNPPQLLILGRQVCRLLQLVLSAWPRGPSLLIGTRWIRAWPLLWHLLRHARRTSQSVLRRRWR